MGNLIDLPNITPDSIVWENQENKKPKNTNFDAKNYLNVRLEEGQSEKTLTIRLLPMDLKTGNPFVKVHVHNVKVPKELVKPGQKPYKDYICLSKNSDIDHDRFGNDCPFCEINRKAYNESLKTTDPVVKKELQSTSLANLSREAVIVRCIERGKEDEGVKFWKFKTRTDKTDPYNQILKLYQLRKEAAEKKGKTENILDIYDGRDLNITINADANTSAPQIVDDSDRSPLSESEEQMRAWIYDKKKWQDVFTCKPYEYLNLVAQGRIPWYDKEKDLWVDKEDYEAEHGIDSSESDEAISEANDKVAKMAKSADAAEKPAPKPAPAVETAPRESFAASITVPDDDLPF